MRSYWKEFSNDYFFGLKCPKCKTGYTDDLFNDCYSFDDLKAMLFYCPACGHKNIETDREIEARKKAEKGFQDYWNRFNNEE